jgi:hypothetical protein
MPELTDTELIATRLPFMSKRIPFAKRYLVYTNGAIFNTQTGNALKPYIGPSGYASVDIKTDWGKRLAYRVHRLVALCFVPLVPGKTQVNHKDFDKLNNAASNLEWVDSSGNQTHARNGKRWGQIPVRTYGSLTYWLAQQIRLEYFTGQFNIRQLAERYSVGSSVISSVVLGKSYPGLSKDDVIPSQRIAAAVKVLREVQG